jgi:hypothetical protein
MRPSANQSSASAKSSGVYAKLPWIVISLAFSTAWSAGGVMGFQAPPAVWVPLLAEADLDTLVEDGPLSATGGLRLQFIEA